MAEESALWLVLEPSTRLNRACAAVLTLSSRWRRCAGMPSTVIRFYSYDARAQELTVVFHSRRRYVFREVPVETYQAMAASVSKGAFFNRHIRDRFAFARIDVDARLFSE